MNAIRRIFLVASLGVVPVPLAVGQAPPIQLPQIVMTVGHTEIIGEPRSSRSPTLIKIQSSNPSVASAQLHGANQILIVAIAPGKTLIQYYDNLQKRQYVKPVWVETPNATSGGGGGYSPTGKVQLDQVVMLVKHTHNVAVPGSPTPKISGLKSSNPSVATARTKPPEGIQVYSFALGDTFIDFTDDTTGTPYQVHVWVTKTGSLPSTGSASGASSRPRETRPPKPIAAPIGNPKLDRCLVGAWRSQPAPLPSQSWALTDIYRAGGVVFRVGRDGSATFDYDNTVTVANVFADVGATTMVRGQVSAKISTRSGSSIIVEQPGESTATTISRSPKLGESSAPFNDFIPFGSQGPGYTCSGNTLTMKFGADELRFIRMEDQ